MLRIILACLFLSGCGSNWTRDDTIREVGFQVVNIADAWQTQSIRKRKDVKETGVIAVEILGKEPKPGETAVYFGTMALSHFLISRALPPKWRRYWQSGTALYSATVVTSNCTDFQLCPD